MDGQKAAGSVFMCRLCNLFSPSRAQLLVHCSTLHTKQEPPDDIIIALLPLAGEPVETLAESPVKRKRGRPKGSKKKTCKADSTQSNVQREEERNTEEGDKQYRAAQGESHDGIVGLECRDCHRSFSNRRQICKHICLREEEEEDEDEDEEENGSNCGGTGIEGSGSLDPNQTQQKPVKPGLVREKDVSSSRHTRTNRNRTSKEGGRATGNKRSVISVVLTEDETLPGVSKMVPVEDDSAESSDIQPQFSRVGHKTLQVKPLPVRGTRKQQWDPFVNNNNNHNNNSSSQQRLPGIFHKARCSKVLLLQSQLKIFSCEFCNKIFKFRHSLMAHLRTHTQEKPFQCPHCDYASAIKANLNVHLRKHTGEKFSCQHCPFNCLSPGHLKVHIERVHMKVKQHCSFCEKKYSDVKNLLKHMEKRHNLKDPAVHQSYQQLRMKTRQGLRQLLYHCPTCNRRFKNQLERERHLLVHGPQRPFVCLICDHAATKMATLTAHVRKHLFLYMCCVCDGKFVSSHRLRSHLKESHQELDQEQAFTDCINNSYHLIQPGGGMWGEEEREDTETGMKGDPRTEQEGEAESMREEDGQNAVGGEESKVATGEDKEQEEQAKSPGEGAEDVRRKEGELENGSEQHGSQDGLHQAISRETTTPSDGTDEATAVEKPQDNPAGSCSPAAGEDSHTFVPAERSPTPVLEVRTQGNAHASDENTQTTVSSEPSGEDPQSPHLESVSEVLPQTAFQQVISSLQKTRLDMETFQRLRKMYGDLECQYCGKLFWYKVHYNVHVRTHTKEHSHYCSKCSYSSITKSSLKRHQIQKHSGLLLPCSNPGCKYTTPDKYKLQAHLRTHQEQRKSVTCPVCQHSCPEHRLKHHIKTSHPDTLPPQGKGLMVQRAEKCPYCDSYFLKNSSDFQRHIWAHQGLKPYVCSVCDYAGRSRSNLKTHMNRHNTERRHLCDLCGKKFKSKVTLKSHRLSHSEEGKRFQCSECDFTSVSKPSLLRHMEQHAEFKPFRCAHCHYSCNIAGPLKRHYNMKHPDQKYQNAGPGVPDPDALKQQVDIQQIAEFSSETLDAVTSMVAMAPGTVTVVQQVADEEEVGECTNQLMVVNADGDLSGNQVMVVEDAHGLEALTVLTQGDNTHHYIVYVQEHTVEIN
ncbi:Zinc finger protein ZFAT [Liparis tanakae]|uniref:Zinc finger protein ZFAT n=1 Tax=Liparis tanakae TaxID=230148 RepID=A0A4Z2IQP7_9TELE|nr:Zinc finger protein ZFAT [Liparis tanakae]